LGITPWVSPGAGWWVTGATGRANCVLGSPSARRTKEPRTGGPPGGRGVRGPDFLLRKSLRTYLRVLKPDCRPPGPIGNILATKSQSLIANRILIPIAMADDGRDPGLGLDIGCWSRWSWMSRGQGDECVQSPKEKGKPDYMLPVACLGMPGACPLPCWLAGCGTVAVAVAVALWRMAPSPPPPGFASC
jgi:hypothetical protein